VVASYDEQRPWERSEFYMVLFNVLRFVG